MYGSRASSQDTKRDRHRVGSTRTATPPAADALPPGRARPTTGRAEPALSFLSIPLQKLDPFLDPGRRIDRVRDPRGRRNIRRSSVEWKSGQ